MFVKICGVSNAVDAALVNESRADAIGFVMGGSVLPVEIEPAAQRVREIIPTLRKSLLSVLVTHLEEPREIIALAEYLGCKAIQISEPLAPEALEAVRRASSLAIIKTVVVEVGSESYLRTVEPFCDFLLLDSRVAGYVGGTGVTSDWELSRSLIGAARKPVLLAGGLAPKNVSAAIAMTNPAGVDVSTGVSCFSPSYPRKDRKDAAKIAEFLTAAKGAV